MLTEEQIEELRLLQRELREQAEVITDAWHEWVNTWDAVSTAIHTYNGLLKEARDLTGDPMGEFGDIDPDFDPQEIKLDEADAIDEIIDEETVGC